MSHTISYCLWYGIRYTEYGIRYIWPFICLSIVFTLPKVGRIADQIILELVPEMLMKKSVLMKNLARTLSEMDQII